MKYLILLFALFMVSNVNAAYNAVSDMAQERMLSDDPCPINPWIVIGIIVLMYVMYGLFKKRIKINDLFDFIFICFDVILITLINIFGYVPTPLLIISGMYIFCVCLCRLSNWNDYVKRFNGLDKE